MTSTTDVTPRVYVASLSDYNAGTLHGVWIDANQDADAIHEAIQTMLRQSREPSAEEWAIHDHEGFDGLSISEYESIETIAELGQAIGEHGGAYAAYAANVGMEYATPEGFEDAYQGEWESEREYAENLADDAGYTRDMESSENPLAQYVDWDAWTRDLFMGDYYSVEAPGYRVYVFSR